VINIFFAVNTESDLYLPLQVKNYLKQKIMLKSNQVDQYTDVVILNASLCLET